MKTSTFLVGILLLFSFTLISAQEPFFRDLSHWNNTKFDGLQYEHFNQTINQLTNTKIKLCLVPHDSTMKVSNPVIQDNSVLLKNIAGEETTLEPADFEIDLEAGRVKRMCIDLDSEQFTYAKIGTNSSIWEWVETGVFVLKEVSLEHDDFKVKVWEGKTLLDEGCFEYLSPTEDFSKWWINLTLENCSHNLSMPLRELMIEVWNPNNKLYLEKGDGTTTGIIRTKGECYKPNDFYNYCEPYEVFNPKDIINSPLNNVPNPYIEETKYWQDLTFEGYAVCMDMTNSLTEWYNCLHESMVLRYYLHGEVWDTDPIFLEIFSETSMILNPTFSMASPQGASSESPAVSFGFNDDFEGTYMKDDSTYNNYGTNVGMTYNSSCSGAYTGQAGCVEGNGSGAYINMGEINQINGVSEMTFSAWIKRDGTGTRDRIAGIWGSDREFLWWLHTDDLIGFAVSDDGALPDLVYSNTSVGTNWTHVSVVFKAGQVKHYINGVESGTGLTDGVMRSRGFDTYLGYANGDTDTSFSFDGQIDDFKVYSRALTEEEVEELYNSSINHNTYSKQNNFSSGVFYNTTSHYWGFNFSLADSDYQDTLNYLDTTDLISYWRLNGDLTDSFGSNDGTNSGTADALGIIDRSREFDGSSYITTPADSSHNFVNGVFTISTWAYFDDIDTNYALLGKRANPAGSNDGWALSFVGATAGDPIQFTCFGDTSVPSDASGIESKRWYHIVTSMNATGTYYYINGVLLSQESTCSIDAANVELYLGAYNNGGSAANILDGNLDEIKLWNRSLDATEILEIYTEQSKYYEVNTSNPNLFRYYPFDKSTDPLMGGSTTTVNGDPKNATGISSGAIWMDGANDWLDITNINEDVNISVSLWFYSEDLSVTNGLLQFDNGNANDLLIGAYQDYLLVTSGTRGGSAGSRISNISLSNNQWYHLVVVKDDSGTTQNIYLNGVDTVSASSSYFGAGTAGDRLGKLDIGTDRYLQGVMDEVLVYGDLLTQAEVTELYKAGLSQHADTNVTIETRTATSYNLSDANLVGLWSFNSENSTTTFEETGRYNLTKGGPDFPNKNLEYGIVDGGYVFDGNSDYLYSAGADWNTFGNSTDDEPFSVTAWVRLDDATQARIAGKFDDANNIEWLLTGTSSDAFSLILYDDTSSHRQGMQTPTNGFKGYEGQWVFLAGTYDGRGGSNARYGINIYINGENMTTTENSAGTYVAMQDESIEFFIGGNAGGSAGYLDGSVDEVRLYNRTLTQAEVQNLYELGNYHIQWNDWNDEGKIVEGTEIVSTDEGNFAQYRASFVTNDTDVSAFLLNYTVGNTTPAITDYPLSLSNFTFYALNSSKTVIGNAEAFNNTNLQTIEYMNVTFTVEDLDGIDGDITLYYTANGSSACATGNKQNSVCYNATADTWIEFKNGTETDTFKDEGNQGDYISCTYTGNSTTRNYNCQIDEHYNPNIMKWYGAEYNFSDIKWQNGTDQRITGDNLIIVEMQSGLVPLDADDYKLDFRVNYSTSVPSKPLNAYGCNSSYTGGLPSGSAECILIASKLPEELQDDGTKFRGIFTNDLVQELGAGAYIVLHTEDNNPNHYYYIKTYKAKAGNWTTKWNYSTDDGTTYTNLGDGYETEMNINWFYDGTSPTEILFKIGATDNDTNVYNSSIYNMTWDIDPVKNYAPLLSVQNPTPGQIIGENKNVTFTVSELNSDPWVINISLVNDTGEYFIATNQPNGTNYATINVSNFLDGVYNLTTKVCETGTADLFCDNDSRELSIFKMPEVNITSLEDYSAYYGYTLDLNYTVVGYALDKCWLYDSLSGTNHSYRTAGENFTNIAVIEFPYSFTVYCNDSNGFIGSSTRNILVEQNPIPTITTPTNGSSQNLVFPFTMTCSDYYGIANMSYTWLGVNHTYPNSTVNLNAVAGSHNITAYCEDISGYFGSVTHFFTTVGSVPATPTTRSCRYKKFGYYDEKVPFFKETGCV